MLIPILLVILGLAILIVGGEFLVRGASNLALSLGMTPLVVGLVIVAFGTSAPELFVSVSSGFKGASDIAIGNVVGSNIINILLVLGASAIVIPLLVQNQIVKFDLPVMIAASLLFVALGWDLQLSRLDGFILFGALIVYIWYLFRQAKKDKQKAQEFAEEVGETPKDPLSKSIILMVLGLVGLAAGSNIAVVGAVDIAKLMGLSELVIGLTIVAFGTSLPEVVTSIVAALKKQRDLAVGNIVGSNIFNILCVLGLTAIVKPIAIAPEAFAFDVPVMLAVTLTLIPVLWCGFFITRTEGILLLGGYFSYTTYIVLYHTKNPIFKQFQDAMLYFALPMALLTLGIVSYSLITGKHKALKELSDSNE